MSNNIETARLWLKKADNDFKTGKDQFETDEPATDTICFHMQQAVEKYLKAFIVFKGLEAEKTHNISRILEKCISIDNEFSELRNEDIEMLTPYGTVVRYPDDFYIPTNEEAGYAIKLAETVKNFIQKKISTATPS
ncbi:MAG TPA: HEPN domain-containing protein [bacterium]|nr:HEPN domain-containing protein [bacterium]